MRFTHRQRSLGRAGAAVLAVSVLGTGAAVAAGVTGHAGPAGDGTAVTPAGYRVQPAGVQTTLGDLPLSARLSPAGDMLLVSNGGQGTQSLQVVDPRTSVVTQTLPYDRPAALFVGLAFSADGRRVYASGGGSEQIHVYDVAGGLLTETTPIALPRKNPAGAKVNMFPAGLEALADGTRLVVADHLADAASVIDLATGAVQSVAVGHAPYGVAVGPDGKTAYVSNQGADTVSVLDLTAAAPRVTATVTVGTHPNAVLLDPEAARLYVADGDSDTVTVLDTATNTVAARIDLAPYERAEVGSNPVGLALSPDRRTLYVTNSGNNAVAVVDVAAGQVSGSVPTGWYPTGVVATGDRLFVANAKGLGAGPNNGPGHPDPTATTPTSPDQYVGSMMAGSLSTVPLPLDRGTLKTYTRQVASNDGFDRPRARHRGRPAIKHVIYVVQENRTYDQVFGSLGKGDGDASLNLFGEESAPN